MIVYNMQKSCPVLFAKKKKKSENITEARKITHFRKLYVTQKTGYTELPFDRLHMISSL